MTQKTNAARLLDQMAISYELREYEADPDDLSAETVAEKSSITTRAALQEARRPRGPAWNLFGRDSRERGAGS